MYGGYNLIHFSSTRKDYTTFFFSLWHSSYPFCTTRILNSVISGGSIDDESNRFVEEVLADGSRQEWETGLFEKRRKAVRDILAGSWNDAATSPEDKLFAKKGWNRIDSGFRLWGGGIQQDETRQEKVIDEFLLSKGWNEVESGFRIL